MSNIGVFLVARTLVILRSVCFPIAEAHPAELVPAVVALHVVAAPILLNADMALRALRTQSISKHIPPSLNTSKYNLKARFLHITSKEICFFPDYIHLKGKEKRFPDVLENGKSRYKDFFSEKRQLK